MKTYWLIVAVLMINLSLLLINDYFPGTLQTLGIPPWALFVVMAAMIVLTALRLRPNRDKRVLLLFPIISVVYPLLLLVVMTALGGQSQSGLSLTSPILWIAVLVTLATFRTTYKKASQDAESA